MFADVIREARNEHEIYFLLTSYVEAVRFGDQLNLLPETMKRLPLTGNDHVKEQYRWLVELHDGSKNKKNDASLVIEEALPIFGAAVDRLESLTGTNQKKTTEPA